MDETRIDTLKDIKLTKEGKNPQQEVQYVADWERAEILADKTRDTIIKILRIGIPDKVTREEIDNKTGHRIVIQEHLNRHALSVVEIANLSKNKEYSDSPITKSQVYHHLNKLIENKYVIKYGTVKTGKRTTDFYYRTSKIFVFSKLPGQDKREKDKAIEYYIERIKEIYGFEIDKEEEKKIIDLVTRADVFETQGREFIIKRAKSDSARTQDIRLSDWLSQIYAFHYKEYIEIMKQLNEILFASR